MDEFKPKVFISYTWSNEDYINKVYQFVKRLVCDGVDVLFDQYEMKPGKSLNNYMEKCVSDSSVTNVLILLTPDYKLKADSRTGGTGIETQIISPEVYNNLENDKFIPILFDRMGKDVSSCVPIYLKDRYWLDLSEEDHYEEMYMAVLRTIYRKPAFIKPLIGEKPAWLDDNNNQLNYNISDLAKIREKVSNKDPDTYLFVMNLLKKEIDKIPFIEMKWTTCDDFDNSYSMFFKLRNQYIYAINELISNNSLETLIFDFFEELDSCIGFDTAELMAKNNYIRILKHELIIETIAILYKNKKNKVIGSLVNRTYIAGKNCDCFNFVEFFYSLSNNNIYNMDTQLGKKYGDGRRYKLTGIGDYWIRHLPEPLINRDEFSFSDVLLSNLSIAICPNVHHWFALTYVYANRESVLLKKIANSLKSKTLAEQLCPLFCSNSLKELKERINNISTFDEKKSYRFGYSECFDTIELISKYINESDIGSLN